MNDVIVIGGGIVGAATLYYLSQYNLNSLLLEAEADLSEGTTKANSGIIHAGYDCEPNTLKARFNREGNTLCYSLAKELDVEHKNIGSLVLATHDGLEGLEKLLIRGEENGISGLKILSREELLAIEPNIADTIEYALFAPTAGVISPYEFCYRLADFAATNDAGIETNKQVIDIAKTSDGLFLVTCSDGSQYRTKVVINASGASVSKLNALAGEMSFDTKHRRGDYFLLDTSEGDYLKHICFQLPSERGKGILATPTVEGNVLVGPTSILVDDGCDTAVTKEGLDEIKQSVAGSVKGINYGATIRIFAGVRSAVGNDFVIENGNDKNFIYAAGICSPGLTAAPAIGKYIVEELLKNTDLSLEKKPSLREPKTPIKIKNLKTTDLNILIKNNPSYGKIVCRCERVSEGEIVDAIRGIVPAVTVDAVKRRTRATGGRCQGGFCTLEIMRLIAQERQIDIKNVTKKGISSEIAVAEKGRKTGI